MNFSATDKNNILQFLDDVEDLSINALSEESELWQATSPDTREIIEKILALDPSRYGFRGRLVAQGRVPLDIVKMEAQTEERGGEYELDSSTYLPRKVFEAFTDMSKAFSNENPGRKLLVGSGYRSPAFQIVTLLYILAKIYKFDLRSTIRRVAMPKYSQHCSATNTAIDIVNIDNQPSDEDPQKFGETVEYRWLLKNAAKFNFKESYPINNPDGIMWEPWHWQFVG